jgi:hypothetical protein
MTHVSDVICSRAGPDYTVGIHDFAESITFDQEMIMTGAIVEFTYHSA